MKSSRAPAKGKTPASRTSPSLSIVRPSVFAPARARLAELLFAALAVIGGVIYLVGMSSDAGGLGFPLDDSWIPLTFARNLREFGAYSYHARDMISSGSTSPLYVLLLSVLGFAVSNEVFLAAGVGILCFAVAAVFVFRAGLRLFHEEQWLAAVAALCFVLTPRLHSAAVSGMGTMLFIALIAAALSFAVSRRTAPSLLLSALALWVRPDALIFLIALGIAALYRRVSSDAKASGAAAAPKRTSRAGIAIAALLFAGYFVFNEALSGSLFPNSVAAKLAYYRGAEGTSFPSAAFFYYADWTGAPVVLFAAAGFVFLLIDFIRRRPAPMLLPAVFLAGTILAYGLVLPFLYDDGRYLAPSLPAFFLFGIWSVRVALQRVVNAFPFSGMRSFAHGLSILLFAASAVAGIAGWNPARKAHDKAVRTVRERTVAAAEWIRANTASDAVVATHAVGAIGYYADRPLIDILGVVTPVLIPSIGNLDDVERYLRSNRAEFIATMRDRFEVVNVNPLFTTDPTREGVMEVLPYIPRRTHIMAQRASGLNVSAVRLIQAGREAEALAVLEQSFNLDPLSSRTLTMAGVSALRLQDTAVAIKFLEQAITLHPEYGAAMVPLGDIYTKRKEYVNAFTVLEKAVRVNPELKSARASLQNLQQTHYVDSLFALGYRTVNLTQTRKAQ